MAKELGVYDSQVRKWVNHPDFEANMEAQGMKYSSKVGWKAKKNPRKGKRYKSPPHPRGMAENEIRKAGYHDIKYRGKKTTKVGPVQVFEGTRSESVSLLGVGRPYGDRVEIRLLDKPKPKGPKQLKLFKNPRNARQKLILAAREVCAQNDYLNCRLFTQLVTGTAKLESLPKVKHAHIGDVLQFGSSPARHWALYLGKNEVVEVPEWGEPARISSMAALVEEWDKPTYIRRPASQVEAKSMRTMRNPNIPIKSIGLPLSLGENMTDNAKKWRDGLTRFLELAEGDHSHLPEGVWLVAMGFPPPDFLERHLRAHALSKMRSVKVAPPMQSIRLSQYKHSWAAIIWEPTLGGVWYVDAQRFGNHVEATLLPLKVRSAWSSSFWGELDTSLTSQGFNVSMEIGDDQDIVESVRPLLTQLGKIVKEPWSVPQFKEVASTQARLVWEFDQAKKAAKKNPRGSDIYDPREEQLRAQRQAIYESSLLRDVPQLKFKTFRNARGERLDEYVVADGHFPWLQKYIGKKMFRIGVGVQKRDQRLKRKDGYLSLTAKTIGESKKRYSDVDKLVRNRQDYEESLALMRKSTFYRVTPEPTREGLKYFVWPMQPGQRLPKGFASKKRAENVANLANRDAPTVGGAWWKPPKKKYTKRELADWLPPADIWRSK